MSAVKRNVWVISDDKPGHVSQSKGVVAAIARTYSVNVCWIHCRLKYPFLRFYMRKLARNLNQELMFKRLGLFYDFDSIPDNVPDLIISSGGNTMYALSALAHHYGAKSVYSGTLKKYPAELLDLVITVVPMGVPNNLVLPLPPVDLSFPAREPSGIYQAARERNTAIGALLVGGDGAGYHFEENDWLRLVQLVSQSIDTAWLVTTSRRTGDSVESLLEKSLASRGVELLKTVWWGKKPEKVMGTFLSECDFVVCTEDSLSMVAEAIYAGKPVFTFRPAAGGTLTDNDAEALRQYESNHFITRLSNDATRIKVGCAARELPDVPMLISNAVYKLLDPA